MVKDNLDAATWTPKRLIHIKDHFAMWAYAHEVVKMLEVCRAMLVVGRAMLVVGNAMHVVGNAMLAVGRAMIVVIVDIGIRMFSAAVFFLFVRPDGP